MAIGGSGVAAATTANAVFFNPSLLAQHKVRKHRAQNSHLASPVLGASYSRLAHDLNDIDKNKPDEQLSTAITDFNANQTPANAQSVLTATRNLQLDLEKIANESIYADAIAGIVIGIGDRDEGGAFVFSRRAMADGVIDETTADRQLINDYVDAMTFITTAGVDGNPHPELFDVNGNLIDQTGNLSSTAQGRGIVLTELGVAMAWEIPLFGRDIAIGFTPKFIQGTLFNLDVRVADNTLRTSKTEDNNWRFTTDIGVSKDLKQTLNRDIKIGLVVKNIIPMTFKIEPGNTIDIKPQVRAGIAYNSDKGYWAADLDLLENDALGSDFKTQFISLGGEWRFSPITLRAGYKHNIKGKSDAAQGIWTFGGGWRWTSFALDLAYIDSGPEKAAALQLSQAF